MSLGNKTYLVTGASSGIGQSVALQLDALGANVILNGRNEERLQQTLSQMKNPDRHIIAPADLSTINCDAWLKELLQKTNTPLYGVAHCAGEYKFTPLRAYDPAELQNFFSTYTIPMANLFIAACRTKKAPNLSLVTMSSISTKLGVVGNAFYGASRAATESLCRNFATEFASRNIRCNCVAGGHMLGSHMINGYLEQVKDVTDQEKRYPLGFGEITDAANAIIFLLSDMSKWITGQMLVVDGGFTIKGI